MHSYDPGVSLHLHNLCGGGTERTYRDLLNGRRCARVALRRTNSLAARAYRRNVVFRHVQVDSEDFNWPQMCKWVGVIGVLPEAPGEKGLQRILSLLGKASPIIPIFIDALYRHHRPHGRGARQLATGDEGQGRGSTRPLCSAFDVFKVPL